MHQVVCAHCKKRRHCKFRQPGTWVVECELFEEEEIEPTMIDALPRPRTDPPRQGTGRPVSRGAGLLER